MNTNNFEQQDANDTNTVAMDFSSLCSAVQHNYDRNDVRNIFTQLLDTYQPEDGITAYECVLKKVHKFLTNYDCHQKQLLLSMIPLPNNTSNHTINDIFRVTTGFTKLNLNENRNTLQNISDIKNMDKTTDNNISSSKQDFLYNKNVSNFKLSLCEGFPFQGFPENEISTIQNNVKNANTLKLNNNPKNWPDKNNKCQTFCRQYLFDKKYCDPIKTDAIVPRLSSSSHQDTCSLKTCNETIIDFCHDKIPRQSNNVKHQLKKYEDINALDKDKKSGISQIIIDIRQNAIIKQTIKDDIYQMDVCLDGDQNVIVDADDLLAITRNRLKASLNNFLKRAQEEVFVELSAFPRTKSYSQMDSLNSVRLTSRERKSETPHKVLEKDFISNISNSDNYLLSKQNVNTNLEDSQRISDEKMKQKTFNYVTGLQIKNDSQDLSKAIELEKNNLEPITIEERKQDDTEKFICKMAGSRANDVNSEIDFQAHSMSELAAYKKQYYDTLLNIQRAKVAVTNSLACSSDHLTAYNDPYYANYMCQPKHLFHQQRHFTMRPQFSTCPTALSGLSGTRSNQYSWTRPDCKYLLLKQLRLQRQASPLCTRNQDDLIHSYIGPVSYPDSYPFMLNGSSQTKHCRKNLEN